MSKRRPPSPPRDSRGRFLKGHSGNAAGRPKASRKPPADRAGKIPIKRGGRTRLENPKPLIMQRLATDAITGKDRGAARLWLRENRLGEKAETKAAAAAAPRLRSRDHTRPYEEVFLFLGLLRRNRDGHLVIPSGMIPTLMQLLKGSFPLKVWRSLQLAAEGLQVLRRCFPGRKLAYANDAEVSRARADAIEAEFAEFDAMSAELKAFKAKKPRR